MRPNERWLWLGDTRPPADAGVTIWRAHFEAYFLEFRESMSGPYDWWPEFIEDVRAFAERAASPGNRSAT